MSRVKTIDDFRKLQLEQRAWAEKTFPGQPIEAKIKHLKKEVELELLVKPSDISEMADCLLLLLDIAGKQQVDAHTLFEAAVAKFRINQARAWGPPDADGVCEHIRDQQP
jgi:Protein of unknown function (DUF550)